MKPTVPETGTVITLKGDRAVVMIQAGKACRGCGAAEIGLCRAGGTTGMVEAGNTLGARVGDTVKLVLDRKVQRMGFLLAYIIPLSAFVGGSLAGHAAGRYFHLPGLDVVSGFVMLLLISLLSFRKLRRLDLSSSLEIRENMSDRTFNPDPMAWAEKECTGYTGCT